jgi:hypothetical protein
MSSPELFWCEPDPLEVRVQLLAIMLGDQLIASASVHSKSNRHGRSTSAKKATTPKRRPPSPSCFSADQDTMLSLCLSPTILNERGTKYMKEIYDFALARSPNMESYMKTSYGALLTTEDHVIMMAAIFVYVCWHLECNEETGVIQMNAKNATQDSLLKTLTFDTETLNEIYDATFAFERGRNEMTTMKSFVHSLVTAHYKRVA